MDRVEKKPRLLSKSRLFRWAGTLISSALFIWLLSRQDWAKTWESLTNSPVWLLPVVFLLYFSGVVLNTLRWNVLLRAQGISVPFLELLKIVITGSFASNFLPSTIGGDTVRIVSLTHFSAAWSVSVASVVVDRLMNVLAMFTILPFSFMVFGVQGAFLQNGATFKPLGWVFASIGWTGERVGKWRSKLAGWFKRLLEIVQIWIGQPGVLVLSFIFAWLSSLVVFLAIWALAIGLGMPLALYQVMGVMALTYLLSLLPISINGYGVREVAVTTLYMQLGASLEQASTLAVVTRFVLLLEALPGALWLSKYVTPEDRGEGPV
jgi:uncharacterized membrane protein YbhN (UPF0104 family)